NLPRQGRLWVCHRALSKSPGPERENGSIVGANRESICPEGKACRRRSVFAEGSQAPAGQRKPTLPARAGVPQNRPPRRGGKRTRRSSSAPKRGAREGGGNVVRQTARA